MSMPASRSEKPRVLVLTHSLSEVDGVGVYSVSTLRFLAPRCAGVDVYIGRRHRGFASDMPRTDFHLLLAILNSNSQSLRMVFVN